jgi:hypothetical protein
MVNELSYIKIDGELCKACILGKQHRESFSNRNWKARECLKLVHSDLCGPMKTVSFGKAPYFLTFIDDYSNKTRICLHKKSEVFPYFFEFKKMVEKKVV